MIKPVISALQKIFLLPKNRDEKFVALNFFAQNGLQSNRKCDIIQSPITFAPLAQLDRAQASDAWCRRFESAMVCQKKSKSLA